MTRCLQAWAAGLVAGLALLGASACGPTGVRAKVKSGGQAQENGVSRPLPAIEVVDQSSEQICADRLAVCRPVMKDFEIRNPSEDGLLLWMRVISKSRRIPVRSYVAFLNVSSGSPVVTDRVEGLYYSDATLTWEGVSVTRLTDGVETEEKFPGESEWMRIEVPARSQVRVGYALHLPSGSGKCFSGWFNPAARKFGVELDIGIGRDIFVTRANVSSGEFEARVPDLKIRDLDLSDGLWGRSLNRPGAELSERLFRNVSYGMVPRIITRIPPREHPECRDEVF